ncbi:MAG: hypothetical protein ACREJD_10940 [Phycisphaerales bacterium]
MSRSLHQIALAIVVGTSAGIAAADEFSHAGEAKTPIGVLSEIPGRVGIFDPFGDRSYNVTVYDNFSSAFVHSTLLVGLCSHVLEDVSFDPGPYGNAYAGTRSLTALSYAISVSGAQVGFDLRFSFYRPSDALFTGFSGSGSSMINPAASPYYALTITGFNPNCPGSIALNGPVLFPSPVNLPGGDSGLWVDAAILEPGTPGTAPLSSTNLLQINKTSSRVSFLLGQSSNASGPAFNGPQTPATLAAAANPANVGYTTVMYGRDANFDASFTGQSTANSSGSNELRYVGGSLNPAGPGWGLIFGLYGAFPSPPAVPATSLNGGNGFLADSVSQFTGVLTTANKYNWYKFNTANDISYAQTTFLDIDTEGSQAPTAFALYTPDSNVFSIASGRGDGPDPNRPSDLNAQQMSFGVARRPGVGSGEQYSGQDGDLPAGEYYLAVALADSGFGDAWVVQGADPVTPKSYSLNFNNNNQKTFTAPAAISPAIASDLGALTGGTQTTSEINVGPQAAAFVRFSLTNPLPTTGQSNQSDSSPLGDVTYMDITQPGSSIVGEWNFALYNNSGTLANGTSISYAGGGFNNNSGPGDGPASCAGTFAQLSYGTAASRGTAPLDPDQSVVGHPLSNQNGAALNSDQYYLALTLGNASFANSRWGARSTRYQSLTAVISVTSNNRGPSAGCPADFNGDGGVDDADFTFFAKYYNDLTNPTGDIDGSHDGLTDDSDFGTFAAAYDSLVCF